MLYSSFVSCIENMVFTDGPFVSSSYFGIVLKFGTDNFDPSGHNLLNWHFEFICNFFPNKHSVFDYNILEMFIVLFPPNFLVLELFLVDFLDDFHVHFLLINPLLILILNFLKQIIIITAPAPPPLRPLLTPLAPPSNSPLQIFISS